MGYRSDVGYVIKFRNIQDRDAYITLCLAKNDENITKAIEECDCTHLADPIITFRADDVKWYSDFPDVRAHTFIYQHAHEVGLGGYRFLAVGEDGAEEYDEQDDGFDLYDYIHTSHQLITDF